EAKMTDGHAHVVLAASNGKAIRFDESDARTMGRNTRGVRGIRLKDDHRVVGMVVMQDTERELLTISANGYGKRSDIGQYRLQKRGGTGILTMKTTAKTGPLVSIKGVLDTDDLMISTENGTMIRFNISRVRSMGRNTQGVRVINLKKHDAIADVTRVVVVDDEKDVPDSEDRVS
ncbi:MAG: DNA gyrase subunit A, partial [Bacteroidetes bacterium]|nr:DNA gyrase subunit A [Bacteroidota bacterium]